MTFVIPSSHYRHDDSEHQHDDDDDDMTTETTNGHRLYNGNDNSNNNNNNNNTNNDSNIFIVLSNDDLQRKQQQSSLYHISSSPSSLPIPSPPPISSLISPSSSSSSYYYDGDNHNNYDDNNNNNNNNNTRKTVMKVRKSTTNTIIKTLRQWTMTLYCRLRRLLHVLLLLLRQQKNQQSKRQKKKILFFIVICLFIVLLFTIESILFYNYQDILEQFHIIRNNDTTTTIRRSTSASIHQVINDFQKITKRRLMSLGNSDGIASIEQQRQQQQHLHNMTTNTIKRSRNRMIVQLDAIDIETTLYSYVQRRHQQQEQKFQRRKHNHHNYYYHPLRRYLSPILKTTSNKFYGPDYNNLHIESKLFTTISNHYNNTNTNNNMNDDDDVTSLFERTINVINDYNMYEKERFDLLEQIDNDDEYTVDRGYRAYYPYDDIDHKPDHCQRPKWSYDIYPICNIFHDTILYIDHQQHHVHNINNNQDYNSIQYLDHGYFRDTYLLNYTILNDNNSYNNNYDQSNTSNVISPSKSITHHEKIVLKSLRYTHNVDAYNVMKINSEAIIMERLNNAKHISNIYGHCGTSILVEYGYEVYNDIVPYNKDLGMYDRGRIKQKKLDTIQKDNVYSFNENIYTMEDKLQMIITMTESIAELHGYVDGSITMDDVIIWQWLKSDVDGRLILNDFGNSAFIPYNIDSGEYCTYWASYYGTYRAPEEYFDGSYVNEKVDIWPVGNIIFSLLTGLYSYYHVDDEKTIQTLSLTGPPYIDSRYYQRGYIERSMIDIMNQCYQLKPEDRISIFDIIQQLYNLQKIVNYMKSKKNNTTTRV